MSKQMDVRIILTDDADEYDLAEALTRVDCVQSVYELRDGTPYGMPLILSNNLRDPNEAGRHRTP